MRKLVTTFVKYPFYANLIIAFLLLAGGISMMSLKKSFFPERKARFITVQVSYPGASPKEMEEGITTRIEEAVRGIVGIKEMNSTSSENFSSVRIETTGEYDLDETLMEVKNAVDGISSMPTAAERPIVYKQRSTSRALFMAVSGDVDLKTLKKYAQNIENDFLASGRISQVSVNGYPPLEISVEIKENELLRYSLTISEITQAIAQNNSDISGGMIKSDDEEILIRSRARSVNPNKISEIILRAKPDGRNILIRDVADVKLKFADVSSSSLMNGKEVVYLNISKLVEEDLKEISDYCNQYAEKFNLKHNDVKLEITFDYLSILNSRLDMLVNNGIVGILLVLIALALFLNLRLSFWVAWGIPSAFLGMFILAYFQGVTINMISLFGMILVIGILVDDGIVIGENIFSHFESGKSPRRAAIDGTMEVLPAVVTSVLTTMVAFSPLFFIKGNLEMLSEMAFIVVVSLGLSLFEAFFVLPAHLGSEHVLRRREAVEKSKGIRASLNKFIALMRDRIYGKVLRVIIRWKYVFFFIPVALIFVTAGLFKGGFIQATFFPNVAFDMFNVDVAFTPGSGEKQTKTFIKKFEDAIWEVNTDLKKQHNDTSNFVTYTFANTGNAFNGQESGAHAGNIMIILRDLEGTSVSSMQVANLVKKKIGKVPEALKFTVGAANRWGYPVSVSLLSKNGIALDSAKNYMLSELKKYTSLKNVNENNAAGKQEVQIKLKDKAYFLGLNHAIISRQIRQGFYGEQAQRLQHGKDELRVWVRYPKQDRLTLGQLEKMKIKTALGEFPLTELVDYDIERGPVSIQRYNSSREVRVTADLVSPNEPVPPILQQIGKTIIPEIKKHYPDVKVEFQGQQKHGNEAMGEIQKYFGIAFMIIILILMLHFRSAMQATIVIMMIPPALFGVFWGHGIHGMPVSMMSAWGVVALSGVIINDAVVFLSKYNSLLIEGNSVEKAVFKAGISRFRPILLTTITTTLGLYPIILEKSIQAQFLIPMAISLAYGVFLGTGFILILFPVLILVLNDIRYYWTSLWTGVKPTRESVEKAIIHNNRTVD